MKIKEFFYNKEKIENVISVDTKTFSDDKGFEAKVIIYFVNGDSKTFECQYVNVNANTLIAGDITGKIIIAKLSDQVT
jgi:hypothetical protein